MDPIRLSKNPSTIVKIMKDHRDRCIQYYGVRRMTWALAWHYMQGIRNFKVWDPVNRRLTTEVLDDEGRMEFVGTQLLKMTNEVAGHIQGMDLRPKVDSQGYSLDSQRSKAVAQVVADAMVNDDMVRRIKGRFSWNLACLGFAGIQVNTRQTSNGIKGSIEVLHPREVFPFPLPGEDVSKVRGIFRIHYVTKQHLEEEYGKRKINANLDKLEWWESRPGDAFDQVGENEATTYWTQGKGSPRTSFTSEERGNKGGGEDETISIVRVLHLWLLGEDNVVDRYVCSSGDLLLQDEDLQGLNVSCPIHYARCFEDGTFHGQGMFDLAFSTHRKAELLDKYLVNSTLDLEKFPTILIPQGTINQNQFLNDVGRGMRVLFYDLDPTSVDGLAPQMIQPYNPGDIPGRVSQYFKETLASLSPIRDLLSEKGRVESAMGLSILQEQITRAMTTTTGNVVTCWGDAWKALVQKATFDVVGTQQSLPVSNMSLDLAGAVIENGMISFPRNPIPDLSMVSFTVRSVSPKNTVARKEELLRLWQMGVEQDPVSFKLAAHREGFDFPIWMEEEKAAYDMAVQSILQVVGDGETPGQLVVTPYTSRPEIFLRVFNGFLTGPLSQKMSVPVINALGELRDTMISFMGMVLPAAIPNPDDAAMLSMGMGGTGSPAGSVPSPMQGEGEESESAPAPRG